MRTLHLVLALILAGVHGVRAADTFHATECEGTYPRHLQGISTGGKGGLFWCWTNALVKTKANQVRVVIGRSDEKTGMVISN